MPIVYSTCLAGAPAEFLPCPSLPPFRRQPSTPRHSAPSYPLSLLRLCRNVGCIVRFEAQQPPEIDDPKLVAELMAAGQHVQLAQGNHHDYVAKGNGANGHEEVASLKPSEIEEANGPGKV